MLDVRRLLLLREVAARGSIAAAARKLNYTRSAVSQQMSVLEQEAGTTLLTRTGRRAELTPAGRLLVAHTDRIVVELESADAALRERAGDVSGLLRVGVPFRDGPPLAITALTAVRKQHPLLTLQLRHLGPQEGPKEVRLGHLDLALATRYGRSDLTDIAGVHLRLLGTDGLRLAVPADHPFANARRVRLDQLARDRWVLGPGTPLGALTRRLCEQAGFQPDMVAAVDDAQIALGLVGLGWGVTVAPDLTPDPPDGRVVRLPLADALPRRYTFLALREGSAQAPGIAAVLAASVEASETLFA